MSEAMRAPEPEPDLNDDDREWLEDRLVEYRELLAYLREH